MMRIDNNLNGLNMMEELARAREIKNSNQTSKAKNIKSNQTTDEDRQTPKTSIGTRGDLDPTAVDEWKTTEIFSLDEARKVLNDTGERMLSYPNDLFLAQANNKPEAVLKLIS